LKKLLFALCPLLATSALAIQNPETSSGAIQRAGHDPLSSYYVHSITDNSVAGFKKAFEAPYVAVSQQIPSQAIVVSPGSRGTGFSAINEANVAQAARNFLSSSGLLPSNIDLAVVSAKFVMDRLWFVKFRKEVAGIPVHDAGIGMAISSAGKIMFLWGELSTRTVEHEAFVISDAEAMKTAQGGLAGEISGGEYLGPTILPLYIDGGPEYRPTHRYMVATRDPVGAWEIFIDAADGRILERTDRIYYDNISGIVSGTIQPLFPTDPWEDRNFFDIDLNFSGLDPVTTDRYGHYSVEVPGSDPIGVDIFLRGPFMEVWNEEGPEGYIYSVVDPPADFNPYWDESNSLRAERDGWYSGVFVHSWVKTLDPAMSVMDYPMGCNVYVAGSCNAFWSGWDRSINFYRAGNGCNNTAQIADVVYHEYGHGVTDLVAGPDDPNGAIHEGFSDYLACTITNQPIVGRGFYSRDPDIFLRSLDNDMRYPDDWSGEPHNDGEIIGGALWHTRADLSPHPMGYVDSLWHYARYAYAQEFEPYFWAFLALDDDDGDLDNGTPNAWTIFHNFGDRHGIGPGTVVTVFGDPISDSEDTTRTFTVTATVEAYFDTYPDSVILYYDNGGGFRPVVMQSNGSQWQGIIPRQNNGTTVNYYVLAVDRAHFRGTWPEGAPEIHHSFYVGPDIFPPTMSLTLGPPNTVNLFGPYGPFVISAFDNNGIDPAQVKIHYFVNRENESVASLLRGQGDGEFEIASINLGRQLFTGDIVHYYFTAMDQAHIPNTGRLPETGSYELVMVTSEVYENFEVSGLSAWTCDQDWFLREGGYQSMHSVWYSTPNYPNNANSPMTYNSTIDLSPYQTARITFYYRGMILWNDTCTIEATNDNGQTWYRAGFVTNDTMSYTFGQLDISSILRGDRHQYKIRFRFISDEEGTAPGIIFDNVGWSVDPVVGVDESEVLPAELSLGQNYPNPFNPATNIRFSLPAASDVRLEIFDIMGRRVAILLNEKLNAGAYSVRWDGVDGDGSPMASGVYLYRLTTDNGTRQEKMTLLR
jgi:hypothetical protein